MFLLFDVWFHVRMATVHNIFVLLAQTLKKFENFFGIIYIFQIGRPASELYINIAFVTSQCGFSTFWYVFCVYILLLKIYAQPLQSQNTVSFALRNFTYIVLGNKYTIYVIVCLTGRKVITQQRNKHESRNTLAIRRLRLNTCRDFITYCDFCHYNTRTL